MGAAEVEKVSALVPHLLTIPHKKIWVDLRRRGGRALRELQEAEPCRRLGVDRRRGHNQAREGRGRGDDLPQRSQKVRDEEPGLIPESIMAALAA